MPLFPEQTIELHFPIDDDKIKAWPCSTRRGEGLGADKLLQEEGMQVSRPPLMRAVIDAVFGAGSDALTFP